MNKGNLKLIKLLVVSLVFSIFAGTASTSNALTEYEDYRTETITVYEKAEGTSQPVEKKSFTRSELETFLEKEDFYYSGFSQEPSAVIGRADKSVDLMTLLENAGTDFKSGDKLTVATSEGQHTTFTYDDLYGAGRYYFPFLYTGESWSAKSNSKSVSLPHIVISDVFGKYEDFDGGEGIKTALCSDIDAYSLAFGLTIEEFSKNSDGSPANATLTEDGYVSHISSLTVEQGARKNEGGADDDIISENQGQSSPQLSSSSDKWDGVSADISWYLGKENDTAYTINSASQLAGLSALVNGLINEDCIVDTGTEKIKAGEWNNSKYVNNGTGTHGACNRASDDYSFGIENFEGKTITLSEDLDMSSGNYMPVGGQYLMKNEDTNTKIGSSFCGVFDGGGHYIKIICERYSKQNYGDGESVGLIGRIGIADFEAKENRPSGCAIYNVGVMGTITGNRCVGGVLGKIGKTDGGVLIRGCVNYADVTGTDAKGTGGICGAAWTAGTIQDCYNAGSVKNTHASYGGIAGSDEIKLENCYNIGKVSGIGYSAAISTSNGGDTYKNCFWLDISADMGVYNKDEAEVTSMKKSEMKTDDFAKQLGDSFLSDTQKINNGYPILVWQSGKSSFNEATQGDSVQNIAKFTDISEKDWFSGAVSYVTENGIMKGTSETTFEPYGNLSRAMFAVVLYRMEKLSVSDQPENTVANEEIELLPEQTTDTSLTNDLSSNPVIIKEFSDVVKGSWYEEATIWASSNGILKGYEDGTFKPDAQITREEMATLLYRYEQYLGGGFYGSWMFLPEFEDVDDISEWAFEAVCYTSMNGMIVGMPSEEKVLFYPQRTSTRAELAEIIMRFCSKRSL